MIAIAPMQGYTGAPFRRFHADVYGAADCYFSPFIRVEAGEPRQRDLRDITSQLNDGLKLVPQIIFKDLPEFIQLVNAVIENGYNNVDLNMGCPFPPQVKRGRGAGLLRNPELLSALPRAMSAFNKVKFSVKMRLGVDSPRDWEAIVDSLNEMSLSHVTVHPRIASQQYRGDLHLEALDELASHLEHPIVFNGDLTTTEQLNQTLSRWSGGVMVGRGVLARPSLIAEWREGETWSIERRLDALKQFHTKLFDYNTARLCGDSQLLMSMKPFWEYMEGEIGRRSWKLINKSRSITQYLAAINTI